LATPGAVTLSLGNRGGPGGAEQMTAVGSEADLAERLRGTGYLADNGLAAVGYLALALHRPLLLEGEPGAG
jgi:MoxR-like ATPase